MSKSILVINTPKSCRECPIFNDNEYLCCGGKVPFKDINKVQGWCPLKPIPKKRKVPKLYEDNYELKAEIKGWNECIEKMLEG